MPDANHSPTNALQIDALGTHWWIEPLGSYKLTDKVQQTLRTYIKTFEQTYTRFSDTSLLGQLNKSKQLKNPPVELIAMLTFARDMQLQTNGVFNISVGGELVQRGYGHIKEQGNISSNFWDEVNLAPDIITIPGEITLDFGGFGKGWLIDEIGKRLRAEGVEYFVINGGGDILVSSLEPVELALEHPYDQLQSIGSTRITQGALAVSSSVKRSWLKDGKKQHHIIDPRTRAPSMSDIICTYVRAETALIADACATVLLIEPKLDKTLTETYTLKTILLHKSQLKII